MAKTINLDIPASASERAARSVLQQLLGSYRTGDLNFDQVFAAIMDWHKADAEAQHSAASTVEPVLTHSLDLGPADFILGMHPDDQFRIAARVAGNVGYDLVPEPEHPDSPHAAPTTSPEPDAVREALEASKAAMLRTRTASIAGCHEGYGNPTAWADELYASHGDLTKAIKLCDAALSRPAHGEDIEATLKPFADLADAMYVSGHCGGASPEDWPEKWYVQTTGGKDHHMPQAQGGVLTVADFRKLARLYHSLARNDR